MAMAMHLHKYEIYQRSKLKWMLIGLIWLFRDLAGSLWRMLMPHHNKHKHTHTHANIAGLNKGSFNKSTYETRQLTPLAPL